MRKKAGFDIENRIVTYYCAAGEASALHEFAEVMVNWGDYIKAETLSVELTAGEPPSEAYTETHSLENQAVILGVRRYQVQRR
jgi:hypothetical protein